MLLLFNSSKVIIICCCFLFAQSYNYVTTPTPPVRGPRHHRNKLTHDDGHHRVFTVGRCDVSIACTVHRHLLPAVADEVTVLTGRQPRLERLVKASLAHGEESLGRKEKNKT